MKELLARCRLIIRRKMQRMLDLQTLLTLLISILLLVWLRYWIPCTGECVEIFTEIVQEIATSTTMADGEQYDKKIKQLLINRILSKNRAWIKESSAIAFYYCDHVYNIRYVLTGRLRYKAYGINVYNVGFVNLCVNETYRNLMSIPTGFKNDDYFFARSSSLFDTFDMVLQSIIYRQNVDVWRAIKEIVMRTKILCSYMLLQDIIEDIAKAKATNTWVDV
ncbi:Hypothetical predicted protein [Paramuricea clavata]|uniref:Uncharacterized protein n=1 Tax=Paramuricea clavata TaxID=317549 RepID=A0A6S7IHY8_PARCT|nr:Hypothetical predicted protein [Paramuricea clavata]